MAKSPRRPATLAETLREFPDDQLAALFRARADLVTPLPSHLAQLASRATTRSSLVRALDRLDRPELAVLEALVVGTDPVSVDDVRELLSLPATQTRALIDRLRGLGLVWGADNALQSPGLLPDLLGAFPAGLGPVGSDVPPDDRIDALLTEAGPQAKAAAELLAAGPPVGRLDNAHRDVSVDTARTPVERLLARRLLVVVDAQTVALPRQVGLRLRGGRLYAKGELEPPPLNGTSRDPALVDRTAAGTALEFVRRIEQLLDDVGQHPPATLRAGGLGVRDLRRIANKLDVPEPTAALYLEIAYAAGLLAPADEEWLPTPAYDEWLDADPARRWIDLATGWLDSQRLAGLVGTRDERDRPRAALSAELTRPSAGEFRRLALETLAAAPPGTAPSVDTVLDRLRWGRPRRLTSTVCDLIRWTLTEAAEIGLTGLDAFSGPARALVNGDDATAELAPLLPAPVNHVLLQADLTAVAPGPLTRELARSLAEVADAESHGGATVYRFSPDSVRRALDAGRTTRDLHKLLETSSITPVPQPLSYLVDDVARRHGHLRTGTATAYLRCDDETQLDAVLADRRTAMLGLRRLAPTVLISRQPVRALLDELRALGYEPVAESADGGLLLDTPRTGRAPEPQRRPVGLGRYEPEAELLAAAVRAVRAGDLARASRPEGASVGRLRRTAPTETVEILRGAVAAGRSVWVGYADQHGGISDRIVDPMRIDAGALTAYDHTAGEARTFALHRITGASPVDTP